MSLVNKYIDSGSFLTATAVYDDINLTTKATDGYYQFGGQYRRQVSGTLLTATVCADCFAFDSLDYVSTSASDLCCATQTSVQYYYPAGSTFLTTTNIYTDVNLSNIAADGFYREPAANQYRQITGSVLGAVTTCPSCGVACGAITIPPGVQGSYDLSIELGNTATDVGAIVVYFNPLSYPDGVRGVYDGVSYNTLSSPSAGYIKSTSGVADAYTIIGDTSSCSVPSQPNTSTYNYYDSISAGAWVQNGTESVTINSGDVFNLADNEYSVMVIPKPNENPSSMNLKALGICASTGFNLEIKCPEALPSFSSSNMRFNTNCDSQGFTYYFAKNYADRNNSSVTRPVLHNFVFSDNTGTTPLIDGSYILNNSTYITVTNGVVTAAGACTGASTLTSFFATAGTSPLNDGRCGYLCDTLLYHNGIGTLPQTGDIIYAGSTTGSQTVTWTDYRGFGTFDGDSASTTGIVNASGVIQTIYVCP